MNSELPQACYLHWCGTQHWQELVDYFYHRLESCDLCPHQCRINRLKGQTGYCRAGLRPRVASWNAHHGEEPPLSGTRGSGTIFFSHCTLRCIYCQNYSLSQLGEGKEVSIRELGEYYLRLQQMGCHNVNLVTPTHYLAQIIQSLDYAVKKGFTLPLVFNSSGYERKEIIEKLDGIIDIYMPDIRYSCDEYAEKYSDAGRYVKYNREALKEMFRQVGNLKSDNKGIAHRGLIIRHLVLPEDVSRSHKAMEFIARELSPRVYVSFMSQYFPAYKAAQYPPLDRRITPEEFEKACNWLKTYNFQNTWVQER